MPQLDLFGNVVKSKEEAKMEKKALKLKDETERISLVENCMRYNNGKCHYSGAAENADECKGVCNLWICFRQDVADKLKVKKLPATWHDVIDWDKIGVEAEGEIQSSLPITEESEKNGKPEE